MFSFLRALMNGIRAAFQGAFAFYSLMFGWLLDAFCPGAREALSQPTSPDRSDEFAAREMLEAAKVEAQKPMFGSFNDAATQTIDFCRSSDPWSCDLSRVPERARQVLAILSDDERAIVGRAIYPEIDAWIHERFSSIPIAPIADFIAIDEAAQAFEPRDLSLAEIEYDGMFGIGDERATMRLH